MAQYSLSVSCTGIASVQVSDPHRRLLVGEEIVNPTLLLRGLRAELKQEIVGEKGAVQ